MRDRLTHLQELSSGPVEPMEISESSASVSASDSLSNVSLEEEIRPQALVFDSAPEMEAVFSRAQEVRREIQLIRLDVQRLREQNSTVLQGGSTMSLIRKDSNAIAAEIKSRGESVLAQLRKMEAQARELEREYGPNAAVTRIARTQYACLGNGFRDAMFEYNEAEMSHRETCKAHIQRQAEIVGRQVTGEQVEDMIENGQWNVFTGDVLAEGKTARSALNQIESRHRELVDLESRIRSVHELFLDVALLVEEQGPMMDTIQTNVQNTDACLGEAMIRLERAKRHDKNNPLKKMFCSCFPCVD